MAADLTPENFIQNIKHMNERDRKKLRAEDLIKIILLVPDNFLVPSIQSNIEKKIIELNAAVDFVKTHAISNTSEIAQLKIDNIDLRIVNESLKHENISLVERLDNIDTFLNDHEEHLNGIEQYLRINNLEVVGLPVADDPGITVESTLLEIFNALPELIDKISPDDIDIAHVIPSKRHDKKIVAVCKFVSRKTKQKIIEAKKKTREHKFKDEIVYINDHLSPSNRKLFALASEKKKQLGFKFLWTKQGSIFMRKDEYADVLWIDSVLKLDGLADSISEHEGAPP
jgi:hypothetical protein